MKRLFALALVCALAACATRPAPPLPTDPGGFEGKWNRFVIAYDELSAARLATPNWRDSADYTERVSGLAAICHDRLDDVSEHVEYGKIGASAIALTRRHIDRLIEAAERTPDVIVHPRALDPQAKLLSHTQERAFHLLASRIDLLEGYAAEKVWTQWVRDVVLGEFLGYCDTIQHIDEASTATWLRPASDVAAMKERAQAVRGEILEHAFMLPAPEPLPDAVEDPGTD